MEFCTFVFVCLFVFLGIEKNFFIALPGKGGHSGLVPSKTVCPNPGVW